MSGVLRSVRGGRLSGRWRWAMWVSAVLTVFVVGVVVPGRGGVLGGAVAVVVLSLWQVIDRPASLDIDSSGVLVRPVYAFGQRAKWCDSGNVTLIRRGTQRSIVVGQVTYYVSNSDWELAAGVLAGPQWER